MVAQKPCTKCSLDVGTVEDAGPYEVGAPPFVSALAYYPAKSKFTSQKMELRQYTK